MSRLERIQRLSAAFRWLLIIATAVIGGAIIIAMFTPGQDWVSVGDGRFTELWSSGTSSHLMLTLVMAPIAITLVLGVYWLQRLFGEYQAGLFFTDSTLHCYVWLVWLKAFNFLYGAIFPLLLQKLSTVRDTADAAVSLDPGTLVELIVLLIIVHLLKEAQRINEENQAFV